MTRERRIVLMAAGKVSGSTKDWLKSDEHGVFESQVRELRAEINRLIVAEIKRRKEQAKG